MLHIDPQFPHGIPKKLSNMLFRVICPYWHKSLKRLLSDVQESRELGAEYNARIEENPGLYQHVNGRFHRTECPRAPTSEIFLDGKFDEASPGEDAGEEASPASGLSESYRDSAALYDHEPRSSFAENFTNQLSFQ